MRFRTVALGLSGLGLGCQLIAGDFEIVSAPPPPNTTDDPCLPGQARCVGARLETCNAQRKFAEADNCGSPGACDPTAQVCHPCVLNEYACNGANLVVCGAAGEWVDVTPCATPELCYVASDRLSGGCTEPACPPEQFACDQSRLLRCAPGQDRYEVVEHCASAAGCDVADAERLAAATGMVHCVPSCAPGECGTACTPGSTRCAPGVLPAVEHCSAEGRWVAREVCTNQVLCDAAAGRCWPPACEPNEKRCNGQVVERCTNDLTQFKAETTCDDSQRCDPALGCIAGACTDGNSRCNGKALEHCENGRWEPRHVCATRELCLPTGCELPTCLSESHACDENQVLRCAKGRHEWVEGLLCDEANEVCTTYPDAVSLRRGCDPI